MAATVQICKNQSMDLKKIFFLLPFIFASCSLEYYKSQDSDATTPEFIFNDATFLRFSNGKTKIKLNSQKIEQYKADNSSYAKNAEFDSYDDNGNLEAAGSCELLEAKFETEEYKLFKNIKLNLLSQKMKIEAENLYFDKKSEQITSGNDSEVQIEKDGLTVAGKGFSGSGVSKVFHFAETVNGIIETENSNSD